MQSRLVDVESKRIMEFPPERFARIGALVFTFAVGSCSGDSTATSTSATETWTTTSKTTASTGSGSTFNPTTSATTTSNTTDASDTSSTASTSSGEASSTTAVEPFCGDGHVDPGEGCDDGDDDPADGCLPDCSIGPGGLLGCFDRQGGGEEEYNHAIAWAPASAGFAGSLLVGGARGEDEGPPRRSFVRYIDSETEGSKVEVVESADAYHRWTNAIEFGIDDRVVVGGSAVPTDWDPDADDSFDLWLGLYAADGSIDKSVGFPKFGALRSLGVSGAGHVVTLVFHPFDALVVTFTPELAYQWSYSVTEVEPLGNNEFRGLVVDPAGITYVTGQRWDPDTYTSVVLLVAFDPSGSVLWKKLDPSPTKSDAAGSHVFIDASGDIVVAGGEWDGNDPIVPLLARFGVDGMALAWSSWTPGNDGQEVVVAAVRAAPDGGCFASFYSPGGDSSSYLARLDEAGAPVWVREFEPETSVIHSLAYDPAGTLYGTRSHEICAFLP